MTKRNAIFCDNKYTNMQLQFPPHKSLLVGYTCTKTTFWRMFVLLYLPRARGAGRVEILTNPRLAVIVLEFAPENEKVTLM